MNASRDQVFEERFDEFFGQQTQTFYSTMRTETSMASLGQMLVASTPLILPTTSSPEMTHPIILVVPFNCSAPTAKTSTTLGCTRPDPSFPRQWLQPREVQCLVSAVGCCLLPTWLCRTVVDRRRRLPPDRPNLDLIATGSNKAIIRIAQEQGVAVLLASDDGCESIEFRDVVHADCTVVRGDE